VAQSFRLAPEIKAAAEKAARDDHRSLSSLLEKVLADYLRQRGYLPKAKGKKRKRPR
jgi:hypothetical protein